MTYGVNNSRYYGPGDVINDHGFMLGIPLYYLLHAETDVSCLYLPLEDVRTSLGIAGWRELRADYLRRKTTDLGETSHQQWSVVYGPQGGRTDPLPVDTQNILIFTADVDCERFRDYHFLFELRDLANDIIGKAVIMASQLKLSLEKVFSVSSRLLDAPLPTVVHPQLSVPILTQQDC